MGRFGVALRCVVCHDELMGWKINQFRIDIMFRLYNGNEKISVHRRQSGVRQKTTILIKIMSLS